MSITPEQFKAEWLRVSEEYNLREAVVANWAWNDNERLRDKGRLPARGQVTNDDITRVAERALFYLAEELKLGITWECPPIGTRRKLDAVLFSESKDGSRTPEVAWEHENSREKCEDEVARLMTYRAPLSVLVTYLRPLETPDLVEKWLPKYRTWFERRPVEGREFLVIFATVKGGWEFYRYHQTAGFKEMQ